MSGCDSQADPVPILWLLSGVQLATQKRGEGQAFSFNWPVWCREGQIASR